MKETGKYLDRALYQYGKGQTYPFHMPGHKRQAVTPYLTDPWKEDITEITGFDNLHHAEGILKEAQEYGAKIFRAKQTWFLINGSWRQCPPAPVRGERSLWHETAIKQFIMPLI